ncbi:MAG: PQQ-dependent dehydrogenase, methanol/ethanol family [Sphingopyxis sp.]|uniref:PQQ-dependent dehydrogenase, methanol/ethanol family n=1 Tax=Sphingopyxis sp. TaxID=1908224 RepID=UPI002ABBD83D|nr:PQQ-dependent dehydrogenase, methanol/ethanol family [Sphingopyxis sp.]MDZ3832612.1 PQQ-dependent dehydrogenase, methanol/ethanol family [Sphingopyxis sp.]
MKAYGWVAALLVGTALASCSQDIGAADGPASGVDTARIAAADKTPQDWLTYGGNYEEQRHSRLTAIGPDNVSDLGLVWSHDLQTSHGVEATPIVVDGMMYVTGAWSIVYALDARTGEQKWIYDPSVPRETLAKGCCDAVNRGVAVYRGKVYVGTYDGRLVALDAGTGKMLWSKVTVDQSKPYTITGAPRAFKDKIIIGNGGAELGVRGYVTAYDAATGDEEWRFYFTPNPDKKPDGAASDDALARLGNATWGDTGAWTTDGGGGTAWDSMIFDEINDQVIVGTGNASPWNAKVRDPQGNGDNLFLSSVVALDADTGSYKWHFQETPRDMLDYTATQTLILADLPLGDAGARRRVVMHAPKNGFFYVLDARSGAFLSGKAFANQTWASGLDAKGRPIENPAMRQFDRTPFLAIPAPAGAHNWNPMAYSPKTGLAYIPAQDMAQMVGERPGGTKASLRWNLGYDMAAGLPPTYSAGTLEQIRKTISGKLIAWDPVRQKARWTRAYPTPFNGGVLTTATNLLFQGDAMGTFRALDAANGTELWSMNLKSGIQAAPITYEIDGEQYVAIATGWGTSWALNWGFAWDKATAPDVGRVFVFKLGARARVPDPMAYLVEETPKGSRFGSPTQIAAGFRHYSENCMVCHGPMAISSGVTPDLRWSGVSADRNVWDQVVRTGILSGNGMVPFKDQLSPDEAEDIRAYVLDQAWLAVENGDAKPPKS